MSFSLSIEQLLSAIARKGIPLPFEMGTFIVLETTEQVLVLEATSDAPALPLVASSNVALSDEGEVSVTATRMAASEQDACRALVGLLGDLLVKSAPGVTPVLLEIVEQGPSDGQWTLLRLRDDLEASLVPLNRGAMRRILARLLREVRRDADRGQTGPAPDARSLDRELDAVLGLPSDEDAADSDADADSPPQDTEQPTLPQVRAPRRDEDVTAEVDLDEAIPVRPQVAAQRTTPRPVRALKAPTLEQTRALRDRASSQPPPPRVLAADGLDEFERAASSGRGARLGFGLLLLAAALVVGYAVLGRTGARAVLGLGARTQPEQTAPQAAASAPLPAPHRPTVGELRVQSSPERAQVLMLVGKGPALVRKLPVGMAYEFVAVAPGLAPSRAVVPAGAQWQQEGGEPRYELALQLGDASARHANDELGPTRLTQEMGSPQAALGSVRIVTSPPGAKVYQLIGFTPDVRVENLPTSEAVELLVYLGGYAPAALSITEADWKPKDGGLVAEVNATLVKRK
jgi:hypothetical protein